MKIAVPIWEGRVSPVMDSATRLLVIDSEDGVEKSREMVSLPTTGIGDRARFLSSMGIEVLICGAISRQFEQLLAATGIRTSPWFRGNVDEVVTAHSRGELQNENFRMPGCGMGRRRGRKWRGGGCGGGFGRGSRS